MGTAVQRSRRVGRDLEKSNQLDLFAEKLKSNDCGHQSDVANAHRSSLQTPSAAKDLHLKTRSTAKPQKFEPDRLPSKKAAYSKAAGRYLVDTVNRSEIHLLDVRQAAAWLGLSKSTLDKMRCIGTGPRFIRATARAVRYDPTDLAEFAALRRRGSSDVDAFTK